MRPTGPDSASPSGNEWQTIRSLLPYLWAYKWRIALAALCLILAKAASVTLPIVLKHIVDSLDTRQVELIVLPIALLLSYGALRLAMSLFGELRDVIFAKVTQSAIRQVALRVFQHLHSLALRFHLERRTGGVSRDIERGSRGISFLLSFMIFNILPTLLEILLVAGILLALYDWWFAVITLVSVSLYILFSLVVTEWRMKYRRTMNELDSKANTRAIDSLLNYETVKYFGNEAYEARRYDANLADWEAAAVKNQTSLGLLNFGQGAIVGLGMTALLILAGKGVVAGTLTLGDLVLINAYLMQLFMPLNFLGFVYREIKHSLADMEKMFNLLKQDPDVKDKSGAPNLVVGDGAVVFDEVHFGYHPQRPILKGVSFHIPSGKKVAVVGASGGGKSTLARLLFRFYDIHSGRILINGQNIREVSQHSVRAAIGIVPQDTVLFNDTIYYNIAYAKPEAPRDEIIAAAKLAHIHEFIESLPDGYESTVGERGLKLSGGEKQRVAIARTILKKPRILIFDEATSALDSKSEQAILSALREVAANHTTLVIAHRLSTIVDADEILVLDNGQITERGTHGGLLAQNGVYANLWHLQQEQRRQAQDGVIAGGGVAVAAAAVGDRPS
jgi:ATP-binding cassette subfamily B protein